jgi:hypothetical protein
MSTMKVAGFGREVWMKGDRGTLHPSNTDLPGLTNVRVYRDGSLGPRPRWTYDSITNTLNINARIWPARYRYGNGYGPGVDGFVAVNEAELFFYQWGNAADRPYAEYTGGTAPGVAVGSRYVQVDDTRWIVEDKLIDLTGPVGSPKTISLTDINTALDAAFAGGGTIPIEGATQHLGRTFYWGSILTGGTTYSARNRLWYSDAYAPTTFTSSTQYLDFDGGTIEGAVSVGNNLFVWTSAAEWFVIQGRGNPANATVSLIGPGRRPILGRPPARLDNSAVFFSSDLLALIVLTEDGTMDEVTLAHLGARTAAPAFGTLAAQAWLGPVADGEVNSIILPMEGATARSMHNGVWMT